MEYFEYQGIVKKPIKLACFDIIKNMKFENKKIGLLFIDKIVDR